MNEIKSSRSVGIDIVKAAAVFFVTCVHFSLKTLYYGAPIIDTNMFVQSYLRWIFLIAVPLFVTCTGYLSFKKKFSGEYYCKIFRVLIPYVLISIISLIVKSHQENIPVTFKTAIFSIFNFTADTYSWYVNMYIGLFLMAPLFNIVINSLDRKKLSILLGILAFIISVPATVDPIVDNIPKLAYIFFPNWWKSGYPVLFYFIGAYIAKYQVRVKKIICLIVITVMPFLQTLLQICINKYKFDNWILTDYGSLFIVTESVGFFLLLYSLNIKNRIFCKAVKTVSTLTLEIYLFSSITDSIIYKYFREHYFDAVPPMTQEEIFRHCFLKIVPLTFLSSLILALIFHLIYSLCSKGVTGLVKKIRNK